MIAKFKSFRAMLKAAAVDQSGLAMVEFAFIAPVLLVVGMTTLEAANYAMVLMRLNQAAVHVADNASRIGDRSVLAITRIHEEEVNDLFIGVNIQTGEYLDLYENGRVILTSLEQNDDGGQWLHWQRCKGKKNITSAHGQEGRGQTGMSFAGVGETGDELEAEAGEAVMVVEIYYTYQPLIGNAFADDFGASFEMRADASFNVRNPRDLEDIYDRTAGATVSDCGSFNAL